MSRVSFGVLHVFCHYVTCAPGSVFSILTATVASVDEVVHFKGSCYNFRGYRLLLRLPLIVGSTFDALAYSRPSN